MVVMTPAVVRERGGKDGYESGSVGNFGRLTPGLTIESEAATDHTAQYVVSAGR